MQLRNFVARAKYYWQATTIYHVHSPYAFLVASLVLQDRRWYYAFDELSRKYRAFDHHFGQQLFRLMLMFKPPHYCFFAKTPAVVDYHFAAHPSTVVELLQDQDSQMLPDALETPALLYHLYLEDQAHKVSPLSKSFAATAVVIVRKPHLQRENWQMLKSDPDIGLTMDFYSFGLALKHPDLLQKQHFVPSPLVAKTLADRIICLT